jgi:protein-tyrosine phosphatase
MVGNALVRPSEAMSVTPPIRGSYWVVRGRLLAGEYPAAWRDDDSQSRLAAFREAGVTSFVDLTEEQEGLTPYRPHLRAGTRFVRRAIRDFDCPTAQEMKETLDLIDAELDRGETVYVHCWGGRGRTGTVVGCWLVRHGLSGEAALARISELRRDVPGAGLHSSPETPEQRQLVRAWSAHERAEQL